MYVYGGFYMDLDFQALASLDDLRKHDIVIGQEVCSVQCTVREGVLCAGVLERIAASSDVWLDVQPLVHAHLLNGLRQTVRLVVVRMLQHHLWKGPAQTVVGLSVLDAITDRALTVNSDRDHDAITDRALTVNSDRNHDAITDRALTVNSDRALAANSDSEACRFAMRSSARDLDIRSGWQSSSTL